MAQALVNENSAMLRSNEPLIVVSSDTHVSPSLEGDLLPYLPTTPSARLGRVAGEFGAVAGREREGLRVRRQRRSRRHPEDPHLEPPDRRRTRHPRASPRHGPRRGRGRGHLPRQRAVPPDPVPHDRCGRRYGAPRPHHGRTAHVQPVACRLLLGRTRASHRAGVPPDVGCRRGDRGDAVGPQRRAPRGQLPAGPVGTHRLRRPGLGAVLVGL